MAEFLRRHALLITTLLLLISCFQLMSASIQNPAIPRFGGRILNSMMAPVQAFHQNSIDSVRDVWNQYIYLVGVEKQREDLQKRITALEAQNSRLIEFEHENQRLRSLLKFSEETSFRGVPATVIGHDPSNWVRTITINRGLDQGVRPNMAVVDGNAVVGQTTAVSGSSSKVLLLTDNSSAIDALLQSSRAPGIVEGSGQDMVRLRYVLKEHQVQTGERVISSGLGGVYPKGLLIGVVTQVDAGSSGMFQSIDVQPNVDLHRLENVLVIVPEMSGPPPENNADANSQKDRK